PLKSMSNLYPSGPDGPRAVLRGEPPRGSRLALAGLRSTGEPARTLSAKGIGRGRVKTGRSHSSCLSSGRAGLAPLLLPGQEPLDIRAKLAFAVERENEHPGFGDDDRGLTDTRRQHRRLREDQVPRIYGGAPQPARLTPRDAVA